MSKTSSINDTRVEWNAINWRKLEKRVYKLQKRIYQASNRGDVKAVRRLQKTLMRSWSARCLAVRRVTQDNQGAKTAGVDGVKSLTPKQRIALTGKLKLGSKVSPTRRVWIDKTGDVEKRPLGIPTMYDRALQSLVKMALEPEWEAKFEPNSYGFRPGRSCQDAIVAIHTAINRKPKYVLDADIAKCFDCIDHKRLLSKLNTYPTLRRQVRAWLKSGVMDGIELFPTSEGTPQGGVISPLLANIALHGMEYRIKEFAKTLDIKNDKGYQKSWQMRVQSLTLIRYADDFVILHEDINAVQRCKEIISEWLKDMGLELKPSKTRLAHTLNNYGQEEPGFNFLGFNIRQFNVGKYHSKQGFKTIVTPSKKSIKVHYDQIAKVIDSHKSVSQDALIRHLNPIIRGWSNYYASQVSKEAYSQLDHLMYQKLESWANRRHSNKGKKWVANKYWHRVGNANWVFCSIKDGEITAQLLKHNATPIVRHVKVKDVASPYDGNLIYWSSRMGKNPEMPTKVAKLLKAQKRVCAHCNLHFREDDVMEVDHIIPKSKGGKDEYKNLQLLHRHCHDEKTRFDGSLRGTRDKSQVIEEPDEVKVSRPVLKTSQRGDSLA
ncbi:group II intron reverse transcriptase/maturase [Limnoraphis robusta Tam1]|uniref:group II intron reverse transcriptase/maturase n=1 Tax=Limnoraphis robusta TaxID=1118279 RepID=UPI002B1F05FF|nr:group II intron reverse transcriptase/maturase [Limnoraphis robusta]MEA5498799.1 group II intron reverse transcriptase/maturase [Limnoraphis robusta BA-68 BA1]MEA5543318.1 group II intron reverse transcriptase/maturase [Limnoraphis robusta Tam1]